MGRNADTKHQTKLVDCISLFETCSTRVRQLGIFSENETVQDMNTLDLRFLLIDYYLGILTFKLVTTAPTNTTGISTSQLSSSAVVFAPMSSSTTSKHSPRLAVLSTALSHLDSFLFTLELHDALADSDKIYVLDPAAAFRIPTDAASLRADKISRFRREKGIKERLAILQAAVETARRDAGGGGSVSSGKKAENIISDDIDVDLRDSDAYREMMLMTIELCVQKGVEEIRMARDEIALLEKFSAMEAKSGGLSTASNDMSDKLDDLSKLKIRPDSLLSKDGKPRQPFMITNTSKRQEFQKGVFQPGYNLPTMTIDEFLENEFARGNIISGGGQQSATKNKNKADGVEENDNNDARQEEETMKARAWDEFKDDNPTGWGNRMNKG
ncbi:hypothetical protein HK100_009331 [Physocladia obscura]|uniref:TAP42-like protein n=1 Tax=Physocladia obscura TaxID=109957 RepID=A0AAD5XJB9_9FUNG|nr:hypothetical protein HK100_009331 [Physocladia obscura]